MNKKIGKVLFTQAVATIMLFTVPMVACTPTQSGGEDGFVVTLNYNDGGFARSHTVIVDEGGTMAQPATPLREGYSFAQWTTEANGGTQVTFPLTPSADTTLYAQWQVKSCSIVFDWNFTGEVENVNLTKEYGQTVEETEVPSADGVVNAGKQFRYWSNSENGGSRVSFPYTVKNDATFYAYWISADTDIFKLSFNANYENAPEMDDIEVEDGQSIILPDPTLRAGYKFVGWATSPNATAGEVLKGSYAPTKSETLYAVWEVQRLKVNFSYNYHNAPSGNFASQPAANGDKVLRPETDPTRDGYSFIGWYTAASGGTPVDFDTAVVTRSTVYYAHWKADEMTPKDNIFDAEYVVIEDPNEQFPGYSGYATGYGIIQPTTAGLNATNRPEDNSTKNKGYYVTYLYKKGATLRFVINSSAAVSKATLHASLAMEGVEELTFKPTGEFAYKFIVNGTSINYGAIQFDGFPNVGSSLYACEFREFTIGNISLKKGENIIELVTDNSTPAMGGTTLAIAPMVDYIRIANTGSAVLTWSPEYDNLRKIG